MSEKNGVGREAMVTAEKLWAIHRAAAGGVSTISGVVLPERLADCRVGPQETHYAMACLIAVEHGDAGEVPLPPLVTEERAAYLRREVVGRAMLHADRVPR